MAKQNEKTGTLPTVDLTFDVRELTLVISAINFSVEALMVQNEGTTLAMAQYTERDLRKLGPSGVGRMLKQIENAAKRAWPSLHWEAMEQMREDLRAGRKAHLEQLIRQAGDEDVVIAKIAEVGIEEVLREEVEQMNKLALEIRRQRAEAARAD